MAKSAPNDPKGANPSTAVYAKPPPTVARRPRGKAQSAAEKTAFLAVRPDLAPQA